MASASSTRLERAESYMMYTKTLFQNYYKLKQTTKEHIDLVYKLSMGGQAPAKLDSYQGISRALRFLGAGIGPTDPKNLLIAWVHKKNKSVLNSVQEFDRRGLERQAAKTLWGFYELKMITAEWMQGKDEDYLVHLGKAAMQIFASYTAAALRPIPIRAYRKLETKVVIRRAWDQSKAQNAYARLVHSLRLLGVTEEKGEEFDLLRSLKKQSGLAGSRLLQYPWELAHLELVVARWIKRCDKKRGEMAHGGGSGHIRDSLEEVEESVKYWAKVEDEYCELAKDRLQARANEGQDKEEVEDMGREDSPVRLSNPTASKPFQAVTRENAMNMNNGAEVIKANKIVAEEIVVVPFQK